jgi:hypothetical protein
MLCTLTDAEALGPPQQQAAAGAARILSGSDARRGAKAPRKISLATLDKRPSIGKMRNFAAPR